ncbi:hypothetical protein B0O99DRAFT_55243 [Bisporella sp. PMI_857]|nr:hypothetical protein B0O99DRAFT_55243 [Bisporella sp. PMI_857]
MKIDHITYEESRGSLQDPAVMKSPPTSRPPKVTKRMKDYFSARIRGLSERNPSTSHYSPNVGVITKPDLLQQQDGAFFTQFPKSATFPSQEKKPISGTNSPTKVQEPTPPIEFSVKRMNTIPTSRPSSPYAQCFSKMARQNVSLYEPKDPRQSRSLRRKPNLSKLRDLFLGSSSSEPETETKAQVHSADAIHKCRQLITNGRMEKAIPPTSGSNYTQRPAPHRSTRFSSDWLSHSSPDLTLARASRNTHQSSHSHRISDYANYITSGTEVLDDKRRELELTTRARATKFKEPFEYLNYHSFSFHSRHESPNSPGSSESFFCAGESVGEGDSVKVYTGGEKQKGSKGTTPWDMTTLDKCRLCKKMGTSTTSGLCRNCENEFKHPTREFDKDSDSCCSGKTSEEEPNGLKPPGGDQMKFSSTHIKMTRKSPVKDGHILHPAPRRHSRHSVLGENSSKDEQFRLW